jgi:asparagine synthase (glutamine-hydrolysing)
MLGGEGIASVLRGWHTSDCLLHGVRSLNGHFAAVITDLDGTATLICDKCRSIPLFFATTDGRCIVSDEAQWVKEQAGLTERSAIAEFEFEFGGFVQGPDTLLRGLSQVQAGEVVVLRPGRPTCRREFYFQHHHSRRTTDTTPQDFAAELDQAVRSAVARLVSVAADRQICLALSGGSDSTMIALALREHGYDRIRAFTYGHSFSSAVQHSRRVAAAIGLDWDFAEYTPQTWQSWFGRPERKEYYSLAAGFSSLPHIEDWPAVAMLKQRGFIADDAVLVNGQTAEAFLYPVHVMPDQSAPYFENELNPQAVAEGLILGCFTLGNWSAADRRHRGELLQRLRDRLSLLSESSFNASLYEAWVAAERMAKFNINSVRNYEFWGHDWWLPLWDDEVRQFWCSMPMKLRLDRVNTRSYVARKYRSLTWQSLISGSERSRMQILAAHFRRLTHTNRLLRQLYHSARRKYHAAADFRGWSSLFDQSVVQRNYHPGQNMNSLLALEYLNRIEFASEIRSRGR